ncbi:hypothetical protein HYS54_04305 [Candidatus Micrarchaeota archaeon]|nr:hypothetical protein [Candidatus Micrarchaeota archaeon]
MKRALLAVVGAVLALSACTAPQYPEKPSGVVEAFIGTMVAFDLEGAKNYITDDLKPLFDAEGAEREKIENIREAVGGDITLGRFTVLGEDITNDTARVRVEYTFVMSVLGRTNETAPIRADAFLRKENGEWKISAPLRQAR